jgi:DNA-binding CsgD family transcriptional regulator
MWPAEVLNLIAAAETTRTVLDAVRTAVKNIGIERASYHLTAPFGSQVGPNMHFVQFGFPEEWVGLYLMPEFRKNDPIPDFVMRHGVPITWKAAVKLIEVTPERQAFAKMASDCGVLGADVDGLSIPLYGPYGRHAYSCFSFGRNFTAKDDAAIFRLLAISQFAHNRIVQLLQGKFTLESPLSERERDVLYWLARQKSVTDIATITKLSRATVDTYVRRIYSKLGVHDRVAAVMVALRHGLIRF